MQNRVTEVTEFWQFMVFRGASHYTSANKDVVDFRAGKGEFKKSKIAFRESFAVIAGTMNSSTEPTYKKPMVWFDGRIASFKWKIS